MGISFNQLNFNLVLKDLGSICLNCSTCVKKDCLIGYSKLCIANCVKENVIYVQDGMKNIPILDIKPYSHQKLTIAIANILHLCASCKENHFEDCIVNVIRSCYEMELFGQIQEYNGSAVSYIIKLNHTDDYKKAIASEIVDQYHRTDYLENK